MRQPSIRASLLIRCGIGVGLVLCLLSAAVYLLVWRNLYKEIDLSLLKTAELIANQVELENDGIFHEWQVGIQAQRAVVEGTFFQFWDERIGSTVRSPSLGSSDIPRFHSADGTPMWRNMKLPDGRRGRAVGLRISPFVEDAEIARMKERGRVIDPKSLPLTLVMARDIEPMVRTLERLRWMLVIGTLAALGLGYVLIERAIRVSLRPIDRLSAQVRGRTEEQLDSALDVPEELPAELGSLAANFDALLSRVAAIRQRERDFIRHAAHELRTPIAGLRATADLALSQPRGAEELKRHLESCQRTAGELGELVKRLSALARIGQSVAAVVRRPVDLAAMAGDCLVSFGPRAEARGLRITRDFPEGETMVSGDEALVRIILNNLLDNAVTYAPEGGEVRTALRHVDGAVELAVANAVESFPEDAERLFEPLFRREASRHDAGSHLGIGLTLTRDAARAMGGTVRVREWPEGWMEFVVRLGG